MKNLNLDHLKLLTRAQQANDRKNRPNLSVKDPDDPRYVLGRESLTWDTLGETVNQVIEWDGNTEGREMIEINLTDLMSLEQFSANMPETRTTRLSQGDSDLILRYYKVSNVYLSPEELTYIRTTVSGADQVHLSESINGWEMLGVNIDNGMYGVGIYLPHIISQKAGYDASEGVYVLLVEADVINSWEGLNIEHDVFTSRIEVVTLKTVPNEYLDLANVAFTGNYADLHGSPEGVVRYDTVQILSAAQKLQARDNIGAGTSNFSGKYSDLSGTPTLAGVATSGKYSDLSGTPTLAGVATSGKYSDLSGTPCCDEREAIDKGSLPVGNEGVTDDLSWVAYAKISPYRLDEDNALYTNTTTFSDWVGHKQLVRFSMTDGTYLHFDAFGNTSLLSSKLLNEAWQLCDSANSKTLSEGSLTVLTDTGENWVSVFARDYNFSCCIDKEGGDNYVFPYGVRGDIKKLDEKYLPESITTHIQSAMDAASTAQETVDKVQAEIDAMREAELIIDDAVLTSPNGTKYCLSVDDEGNLTAVKVEV